MLQIAFKINTFQATNNYIKNLFKIYFKNNLLQIKIFDLHLHHKIIKQT